jgi:hypothetical protein
MEAERQTSCTLPYQQYLQLQYFFFFLEERSNIFSFSLKNDMVLLHVSWIWILHIDDLCDIFGKNKWLFSVTEKSEIDIHHNILVGLHSI